MKIKTDKDAFDFVRSKLIAQGKRSMNYSTTTCSYRGYSEEIYNNVLYTLYGIIPGMENYDDAVSNVDNSEVEIYITRNNIYDLKCAVGHLIKDEYYDGDIEGEIVSAWNQDLNSVIQNSNRDWDIDDSSIILMQVLQKIHDDIKPFNWAEAFNKLEQSFGSDGKYLPIEKFVPVES